MNPQVFEAGTILTLVLPALGAICCWRLVLRMDEAKRPSVWLSCLQASYVAFLALIGIWWCFWDAWQFSILPHSTPISLTALVLLALPILPIGFARLILIFTGAPILNVRRNARALSRISAWRTVESTVALIFLVLCFEALYRRSLFCLFWIVLASTTHIFGKGQLRKAEGWKFTPVKSGDLHKRTFQLAREQGISIKRVCVVPVGKGHLMNAFASPRTIGMTENYSRFNSRQLDFIICHELIHARDWHGVKRLLVTPIGIVLLAVAVPFIPPGLLPRLVFNLCVIFLPILASCAVSRHFEFAADMGSVLSTKDEKAAVDALRKVCESAQVAESRSRLLELFGTHPNLTRRLSAIERSVLPAVSTSNYR